MSNTIRIKRRAIGGASGLPSSLAQSELAYSEVDGVLSIGVGTGGSATVVAIGGPGAYLSSASASSTYLPLTGGTISQNLTITGNLTVSGTTTTINSTTLAVADKNIELAKVASPTDATADGAGLTVVGATNHTWNWVDATDAWTSSEHVNLNSGKAYYINGTSVLNGTTLGSGVTGSSLTSTGTVTAGTWSATIDNTSIDGGAF